MVNNLLIDTHAHSYDEQFSPDRIAMLERAWAAGIAQIWLPNCNSETIEGLLALADAYPDRCLPMMGLHPTYVKTDFENELAIVEDWLARRPFRLVGEIGLDFYWDLTFVEQQKEAFRFQLQLASKYQLPISIHCRSGATRSGQTRNAFTETADLIQAHGDTAQRGIFHCFTGTLDEAKRAVDLNFLLGIGGVVTFKNGGLDQVLPHIGLEHLVLETDAPYLAPVPHRGGRNESAYVGLVAQRVADLKRLPLAEVIQQTTQNARRLVTLQSIQA
ncbi:MAG: TatD family hydrolase [Cytophagaceae bacterium]|nr:TatD family hydrolase [Cytophagaceae bacterium]